LSRQYNRPPSSLIITTFQHPIDVACHYTIDVACHYTIDVACHYAIDVACHYTIDVACHYTIDVACHYTIDVACHCTIDVACHYAIDVACHYTIDVACHYTTVAAFQPNRLPTIWFSLRVNAFTSLTTVQSGIVLTLKLNGHIWRSINHCTAFSETVSNKFH
jgi:hypothetical protein